jgi:hypothetical protein
MLNTDVLFRYALSCTHAYDPTRRMAGPAGRPNLLTELIRPNRASNASIKHRPFVFEQLIRRCETWDQGVGCIVVFIWIAPFAYVTFLV